MPNSYYQMHLTESTEQYYNTITVILPTAVSSVVLTIIKTSCDEGLVRAGENIADS